MKLGDHHEIVGVLARVETNKQHIKLEFTLHKTYEIPIGTLSIEELKSAIGSKVGIFNCDGNYRIRRAKKK